MICEELEAAATAHDDLIHLATVRMAQLNLALFKGQLRYARRRCRCWRAWATERA